MLGGGRKEVEDAAAHRELAPPSDHVDPVCRPVRPAARRGRRESTSAPIRRWVTGSMSPGRPIGCSSERAVVTTTRSGGAEHRVVGAGEDGAAASGRRRVNRLRGQLLVRQRLPRTGTARGVAVDPAQFGGQGRRPRGRWPPPPAKWAAARSERRATNNCALAGPTTARCRGRAQPARSVSRERGRGRMGVDQAGQWGLDMMRPVTFGNTPTRRNSPGLRRVGTRRGQRTTSETPLRPVVAPYACSGGMSKSG